MSEKGFKENLAKLKTFLDTIKGKSDIKTRLKEILDPDNIQTSSILTKRQVEFVADCYFAGKTFEEFEGLKTFAGDVALTSISKDGKGQINAINLMRATKEGVSPSQFFNIGTEQQKPEGKTEG